jgi:hypothetical protein
MIGQFFIDNEDVYTKWGMVFKDGTFKELNKWPTPKNNLSHSWNDNHGTQRDEKLWFESQEHTLRFLIIGNSLADFWLKYDSMREYILTAGYFNFYAVGLNRYYTLRYNGPTGIEPEPTQSGDEVVSETAIRVINDFVGGLTYADDDTILDDNSIIG